MAEQPPDPGAARGLARVRDGARAFNEREGVVSAVRRLRRALPGDPGFGDPLSASGSDGASAIARLVERISGDEERATHEISLGALQVWQSMLERFGHGQGDKELTIVFTDIVGFSSWAMTAGDDDALQLLREVSSAVEPAVLAHRGRIVKRLGDGLMATFLSSQQAFDAVVDARERLESVGVGGFRPQLRAGIHTGRPRGIGGDFVGVDVNVAARLAESAGPGETLASDAAVAGLDLDRVATRRKLSLRLARPKGVPRDVMIYAAAPR